jgi:hypothetical protein
MNERIRELADQAKKYALDAMIKITDKEQALKVYSESYDTEFAELIIEECAEMGDNFDGQPTGNAVRKYLTAGDAIREHFGVE